MGFLMRTFHYSNKPSPTLCLPGFGLKGTWVQHPMAENRLTAQSVKSVDIAQESSARIFHLWKRPIF